MIQFSLAGIAIPVQKENTTLLSSEEGNECKGTPVSKIYVLDDDSAIRGTLNLYTNKHTRVVI